MKPKSTWRNGIHAVAYARLSDRRDEKSISIETQIEGIDTLAARRGKIIRPDARFTEGKGLHSARTRTNLKEWERLLAYVRAHNEIAEIYFYDLERGFRNTEAALRAYRELRAIGVLMVTVIDGELRAETAMEHLVFTMRSAQAESYSITVSHNLTKHYDKLRKNNLYLGRNAPTGLKLEGTGETRRLVPSDETYVANGKKRKYLDTILALFELCYDNVSGERAAARILQTKGYRYRNMSGNPSPVTSYNVRATLLRLDLYRDAGVISARQYQNLLRYRKRHSGTSNHSKARVHPPLLLHHLAYCARCGLRLYAEYDAKPYNSLYRHPNTSCCWGKANSARHINNQVLTLLAPIGVMTDAERRAWAEQQTAQQTEPAALDQALRLEDLRTQFSALTNRYIAGDLGTSETAQDYYIKKRIELESEIESLARHPVTPAPLTLSADEWYEMATDLVGWIALAQELDPHLANAKMHELLDRVEIDIPNRRVTKLIPAPAYRELFAAARPPLDAVSWGHKAAPN